MNADMMQREVFFLGLTRDPALVKAMLGKDDPTVFVAEFSDFVAG